MNDVTGLSRGRNGELVRGPARDGRVDLINRPRRCRKKPSGDPKFVLVSDWDPRVPDIRSAIRSGLDTLYGDAVNRRVFKRGSIISGFRRGRNLGEIICPTNIVRNPASRPCMTRRVCSGGCSVPPGEGCRPCLHAVCQIHSLLVSSEETITRSFYDGFNWQSSTIILFR